MAERLHIVTSQAVIRKHLHMRHISVVAARDAIERLALYADTHAETTEDLRMREELQRRTGCTIAELHAIAQAWPNV